MPPGPKAETSFQITYHAEAREATVGPTTWRLIQQTRTTGFPKAQISSRDWCHRCPQETWCPPNHGFKRNNNSAAISPATDPWPTKTPTKPSNCL